jgi:hypothetical protein
MADLGFLSKIIEQEGEAILDKAARDLKDLATQEAPRDKGNLAESHAIERPDRKTRIVGIDASLLESKAGEDYSPHVYFGTRPHKIRVKRASVLTDGENFFGTEVNHPGTKANRWLERALGRLTV